MIAVVPVLLVALISISAMVAAMLAAAWRDLDRPAHARTWSAAFAAAALAWSLPFAHALGWARPLAVAVLMPAFTGLSATCIAIGFRERAGLPPWRGPLLALAAGHALLLLLLLRLVPGPGWIVPMAALNVGLFMLAARTLRGRRRSERAAERMAELGLLLLTLLNLLLLGGVLGMQAGLLTLRIELLAVAVLTLLPAIIAAIGLFTIILLTADLADRTRRLAATDMLTGLLNRRGFDAAAEALFAAARRQGRALALALIDVDHFKAINDRFGHLAGDDVLVRVARLTEASLRGADVVGRMGGEEFVILLPNADGDQASAVAERVRLAIGASTPAGQPELSVTASIGVATLIPGESPAALLHRADCALYAAKGSGRNTLRRAA